MPTPEADKWKRSPRSPRGRPIDDRDTESMSSKNPVIKHLDTTTPTPCPCGQAFRIITKADNDQASFHVVEISGHAKKHYHERHTEYYYCLEGTGQIELNDETFELNPGTAVMIPPMTPHAARGSFRIINVVIPPFDGSDEHLVE